MTSDRPLGGVALNPNPILSVPSFKPDARRPTGTLVNGGDVVAVQTPDATSRISTSQQSNSQVTIPDSPNTIVVATRFQPVTLQRHASDEGDERRSQLQSTANSQDTNMTTTSDNAITPPASDTSGSGPGVGAGPSSQESQLMALSEIAAAQDKMRIDTSSRKRMADGEVKTRTASQSPVKGHSRNISTMSKASTSGSYIGEVSRCLGISASSTNTLLQLSAELRTRLSYAMVKVNNGWQGHSLEEVESLASRAASPSSSTSTVHRRQGSSASPRLPMSAPPTQMNAPQDAFIPRRKSNSPPRNFSNRPVLAPPAPIRPSLVMPAPRSNPRRNSNPHYTPTLLSHSHSASPRTPAPLPNSQPEMRTLAGRDPILYSPHQNVREQDAIESLLFMSSPGNSANLKHAFSPHGSPGPQPPVTSRNPPTRHALPSGPRKALPSQRPLHAQHPPKRGPSDQPSGMPPPGSPMDVDPPQHSYHPPSRGVQRRRVNGGSSHLRGALSLPSGLGVSNGPTRRVLRDEDIERMLDRAGAEAADSSDDEEIQLPRSRGGVAGPMRV